MHDAVSTMPRAALAALVLVALTGCGERDRREPSAPSAPTAPSAPSASPTPTTAEPAAPEGAPREPDGSRFSVRCAASEPESIATGLERVQGIALALGDTSQMIVAGRDERTLIALATRVAPGAAPEPLAMPGADGLFALEPLDGERYVVVTRGACPDGHSSPRCLAARLLGPDARPRSEVATIPLPAPLRTVRVHASGDTLWIARTSAGAQPALDRARAGEGGLEIVTHTLGERLDVRDEPTEILGLAVSGGSWAVVWRYGATEDAASDVVLSTQRAEHDVEALHHALVLESFQWYAGALSTVAAFEFARPIFLRLGADGELRGEPRELLPGEALPQPFTNRRTAAIAGSGERLALEVRDGAGDAIAPRVPIEGAFVADVARRGDTFVVAYARRRAGALAIETREITCAAPAP